jgi:D-alanyl-D-alanine carboxypeptidase
VPRGAGRAAAGALYRIDPQGAAVQTVFERNADKFQPVASTQKMVSAWVLAKHSDLNRRVEFTEADLEVDVLGSRAQNRETGRTIQVGDEVAVRVYLNTMLIESSNGGSLALSRSINGGTRAFVELMNSETDRILGAGNSTFFQNPHGLTDESGYERYTDSDESQGSTASELARLMGFFTADKSFRERMGDADLSTLAGGTFAKGGATRAAGRTILFRFALPSSCAGQGVAGAFFGEGTDQQWTNLKSLYSTVRDEILKSY